ncbi:MAG: thermonuclease family protein [Fuerstiella sp.]
MPRLRRPTPALLTLLVVISLLLYRLTDPPALDHAVHRNSREAVVAIVFDGDTFDTDRGERVRLLGIDAPEVAHHGKPGEPYGAESGEWLRQQLLGRTVRLQIGVEPTDRYGRTLAWVYHDGRLVNQELLATGNARLLSRFGLPPDLEPALRQAEATARLKKIGLWADR